MPYYSPPSNTKTGNGEDLYQPVGSSSIAGVISLRTLTGAVNMTSPDNTLGITNSGNNIELVVNPIEIGVASLNALQGAINIESNNNSINVDVVGNNIDLSANINVGVSSLNTQEGAVTITSSNSTVEVVTTSGNIDLKVAPANVGVESIFGLSGIVNLTSTGGTVAINQVGQNINLETITVAPSNPNTIEGTATFDLADKLTDVTGKAIATIRAQNGLGGEIDMIANAGSGGINGGKVAITANGGQAYGEVAIVANSGVVAGVSTGGLVTITANSGIADTTTTSAIKFSAAGINSYAGAIPSIGSIAGYNFIYGTSGVNICAGLPAGALPNALGTTYIYGTTGVEIPSNLYITNTYPYFDGNSAPSDITINGRTTIFGSAGVRLNNVKSISMDTGAISGVSTINGSAYPPASTGVTTINGLSSAVTLLAGTGIGLGTTGQTITISATGGGVPTQISQGGGSVAVDTSGNILGLSGTDPTNTISFNSGGTVSLNAGLTGTNYNSSLELQQSGIINLTSLSGSDITITSGIIGSGGQQIILSSGPFSPPETGLYVSTADVTFNGNSILNTGVTSFNTVKGDVVFNVDVPLSLPDPVDNTFKLSYSPAFVTPITLASGSFTSFDLTDFYNYGQIILNPTGVIPTFSLNTTALTSAFKYCYIKNSSALVGGADVTIQENGSPINGTTGTSILYQRTATSNTGNNILYWNGTSLFLY